jgi:hypothetical protein
MHGTVTKPTDFAIYYLSIAGLIKTTGKKVSRGFADELQVGGSQFCILDGYRPADGIGLVIEFGMPKGIKLNPGLNELYSGIVGARFISRTGEYCLMQLSADTTFQVFFKDGRVAQVECKGLAMSAIFLQPKEALEQRLVGVDFMFARAVELGDKGRQHQCLFQLSKLLRMSAHHSDLRPHITSTVGRLAKRVALTADQVRIFSVVLNKIGETGTYWWMPRGADKRHTVARSSNRVTDYHLQPLTQSGKPQSEKARKAERANRDRKERAEMKGPSRNDDSNNRRKK